MAVTFLTNEDEVRYTKSVNGVAPDENGNVEITIPDSGQNADLYSMKTNHPLDEMTVLLTIDGFIRSDGTISTTPNARRSDYIEITGSMRSIDYSVNMGASGYAVAFFDADKNILADISVLGTAEQPQVGSVNLSTAHSDARYFVIGYYDVNKEYRYYSCNVTYVTDGETRTKSIELTIDGAPYDNSNYDGGFYTGPNARRSDYIEITDDMVSIHAVGFMSSTSCFLSFYDANKVRIEELDIIGTQVKLQTETIDLMDEKYTDAKYFIVAYYDAGGLYEGYECTVAYETSPGIIDSRLSVLIFGDSITTSATLTIDENDCTASYSLHTNSYTNEAGRTVVYNNWPNLIGNILPCRDIRNYAYSGASYKDEERESGLELRNLSYQVQVALNDVGNPNGVFPSGSFEPDIVIFALGTNDGVPNDTPESAMGKTVLASDGFSLDAEATLSAMDRTKFCEAALWAFLTVKRAFPMALGLCVLPIQRAQGETNANELHDCLEVMAKRYGYIIVDGAFESGIIRDLEVRNGLGTMLKDGLHPNEKGQNLLCRAVLTAIRQHYLPLTGLN